MVVHGVCLYIDSTLPYKEELGNRLLQHAVTVIAWIACVLKYKKQDTRGDGQEEQMMLQYSMYSDGACESVRAGCVF